MQTSWRNPFSISPRFPLFSPYLSLISHPCVLVSFLREIWLNFKALVDHWESTTISRKKKRKKLDPFNGLISPLYFEKKERLKKKKGSNPPYSYIWYFNLLFIYLLFDDAIIKISKNRDIKISLDKLDEFRSFWKCSSFNSILTMISSMSIKSIIFIQNILELIIKRVYIR